jgi:hypothetical protein
MRTIDALVAAIQLKPMHVRQEQMYCMSNTHLWPWRPVTNSVTIIATNTAAATIMPMWLSGMTQYTMVNAAEHKTAGSTTAAAGSKKAT